MIERALIESRGADIQPRHLQLGSVLTGLSAPGSAAASAVRAEELPLNFEQAEAILVKRAVDQANGNITQAARLLGINRSKVYRKLAQQQAPPRKSARQKLILSL